jgi:hypothetical protein
MRLDSWRPEGSTGDQVAGSTLVDSALVGLAMTAVGLAMGGDGR